MKLLFSFLSPDELYHMTCDVMERSSINIIHAILSMAMFADALSNYDQRMRLINTQMALLLHWNRNNFEIWVTINDRLFLYLKSSLLSLCYWFVCLFNFPIELISFYVGPVNDLECWGYRPYSRCINTLCVHLLEKLKLINLPLIFNLGQAKANWNKFIVKSEILCWITFYHFIPTKNLVLCNLISAPTFTKVHFFY